MIFHSFSGFLLKKIEKTAKREKQGLIEKINTKYIKNTYKVYFCSQTKSGFFFCLVVDLSCLLFRSKRKEKRKKNGTISRRPTKR